MYVISVMSMLKIYQTRHPDINASASAAFAALALAVVLGVIGVLTGTTLFWVIFGFIHVISCLLLSCNIYYMGRWKCGKLSVCVVTVNVVVIKSILNDITILAIINIHTVT